MEDKQELKGKEGGSVNLGRHQAQCTICKSPNRQEIEEMWIDWVHASHIASVYNVSRDAQYRHAHALDLFGKRKKNITRALEQIIERVGEVSPSGSAIVSAIQLYTKINSTGQRSEQAQSTNPMELFGRMSPEERELFARDGSLPEWYSRAKGATPSDGQDGEKESQVTETKRLQ
jgi:hypothetical protein